LEPPTLNTQQLGTPHQYRFMAVPPSSQFVFSWTNILIFVAPPFSCPNAYRACALYYSTGCLCHSFQPF